MRLDPSLPWDVLFDRCMQSWRDTAAAEASRDQPKLRACEACQGDSYVCSASGEDWPHWQQHVFHELLAGLRTTLLHDHLDHEVLGQSIWRHLARECDCQAAHADATHADVVQTASEFAVFVDLWIHTRVRSLDDLPYRVRLRVR